MTTAELIKDLDAKRELVERAALAGTDSAPGGMNPLVADALAQGPAYDPSNAVAPSAAEPGAVDVSLGGAFRGAKIPFVPGVPAPSVPAGTEEEEAEDPVAKTFYDLMTHSEDYRKRASAAWERNERADKARRSLAAVSDALSSLGNLVGTVGGASNQTQTYQSPFVKDQVDADRKEYRTLAKSLQENEEGIRLAKMKLDAQQAAYDAQLEKEQVKLQNTLAAIAARGEESRKTEGVKHDYRAAENEQKQNYKVDLAQMDIDYKKDRDAMQAALRQQGINISRDRLDEAIRHNQSIEAIRENGGVGGYVTIITRDRAGREIRRERVPSGSGGSGTKKKNPMD